MAGNQAQNPFTTPAGSVGGTISKIDPVTIPGFVPSMGDDAFDPNKYEVKYVKIDMDDPLGVTLLEALETRALRNDGLFILSKDKFTFMDRYLMIVSYLEQSFTTRQSNANANATSSANANTK
jgi:hypothetical protein